MAQAKKKQATRTAKKQTRGAKAQGQRQARSKQARRTQCNNQDRNHIYIVTVMGMIAALLLCANAVMMTI
ncbi:hypothetical protein IJH24_00690 [Candidatus Saccharibacteria bacterium]|nr:hypothetical protein [Candidatus Saccharibacteria bacterium]